MIRRTGTSRRFGRKIASNHPAAYVTATSTRWTRRIPVWASAFVALCAMSAWAWGPRTNEAIVATATQITSQDGVAPLINLKQDIQAGASISHKAALKICPTLDTNLTSAIEMEMYLLKAVRGSRIDPYYAYRLGVLGKLVATETAPLANASLTYRNLYYADVDANIQQAVLKPSRRVLVDSPAYFERLQREAQTQDDVILKDYQSGLGFAGAAHAALSSDASRSVSAVVDVWSTILGGSSGGVAGGVSQRQTRDYLLAALGFYINRNNPAEIKQAYAHLKKSGNPGPDQFKQVGDMFYNAGQYERAMTEYEKALAGDPHRRDVVDKIATYYISLGDAATKNNKIDDALKAYTKAAQVDPLNANAQSLRIVAQKRVEQRNARKAQAQQNLDKAHDLEIQGDKAMMQNNLASAMGLLRQAGIAYRAVSDEFPAESEAKVAGLRNVSTKIQELQLKLGANAQNLSGFGFTADAYDQAVGAVKQSGQQALRALVVQEYETAAKKAREKDLKSGTK